MVRENHPRAQQVLEMLRWNGGGRYSSGVGIANIDFLGEVHADQFSMFRSFGNVRNRKFSEIWQDTSDPVMAGLKDRLPRLEGRCGGCRFKEICGGGLRARAEIATGRPWAADSGLLSRRRRNRWRSAGGFSGIDLMKEVIDDATQYSRSRPQVASLAGGCGF